MRESISYTDRIAKEIIFLEKYHLTGGILAEWKKRKARATHTGIIIN